MDSPYFVHISDTHFGPTPDYERFGQQSMPCTQRVVELINAMPVRPDFVIHTGDVVTNPEAASYRLAAAVLGELNVPVYYCTGNHDTARDIRTHLPMGPKRDCQDDPDVLSYTFEVKGHRFLVLDARAPDEMDPHGLFSDAQLDVVSREATPDGPPLTIFCHFPALPLNSSWIDENLLILNGERLHERLLAARGRVRGFFYGHIHQAFHQVRDGILYASAASVFSQFTGWPGETMISTDLAAAPGFSTVQLLERDTIIRQHTFPRP